MILKGSMPCGGLARMATTLALLFTGCTMPSVKQPINVDSIYRMDLAINVNGKQGNGVLMAPAAGHYAISIQAPYNLDYFSFRTCHREFAREDIGRSAYNVEYVPIYGLEDRGQDEKACVAEIMGASQTNDKDAQAIIDFEDPDGVFGTAKCNGGLQQGKSTICQSPHGMMQEIDFEIPMRAAPEMSSCAYGELKDENFKVTRSGKVFKYTMPLDKCELLFTDLKGEKTHRHVTFGYQQAFLRKK